MANATVSTFTATPCGPAPLPEYEVKITDASTVKEGNLAAVKIASNPDQYTCCAIDRSVIHDTPLEDAYGCVDSGYAVGECQACNDHW